MFRGFNFESFFCGMLAVCVIFMTLSFFDQPDRKVVPTTDAVMCENDRGRSGELAHFRNEIEGLPLLICKDMLESRKARYPLTSDELFCSPTERCPP